MSLGRGIEFWDWMRGRRVAAVGHGALFFLLTLPEIGLLLLILALMLPGPGLLAYGLGGHHNAKTTALALALPALVVSLLLISGLLLVIRRLASLTRRLVGQWCGMPIADPYLPRPGADGGNTGVRRRLGWLLTDQATWRDLLWVTVNGCVGWLLAIGPAALLALGAYRSGRALRLAGGSAAAHRGGGLRVVDGSVAVARLRRFR